MKTYSHLISYSFIFYYKGRILVKIIKSNFKHALRNAIKIILIILQGDSEAFILGPYWQVILAQKEYSTQRFWTRVSPAYFWNEERQLYTKKKKKKTGKATDVNLYIPKKIDFQLKNRAHKQSERSNSANGNFKAQSKFFPDSNSPSTKLLSSQLRGLRALKLLTLWLSYSEKFPLESVQK